MAEAGAGIGVADGGEGGIERIDQRAAGARRGPTQRRFECGEKPLDRMEVGCIGGQKAHLAADGFDRGAGGGVLLTL